MISFTILRFIFNVFQSEHDRVSPRRNVQPTQNTRHPPSNTTTKPRNSRRQVKMNPVGAGRTSPPGNSGYRRKGWPEDEGDSDGEDSNTLIVSNSVAEERLRAISGSSQGGAAFPGVKQHRSEPSIQPPAPSPPIPTPAKDLPTATEHAPPEYTYNSPIAAIPSTPWTTRQNMLRTETSEDVRQNLLWPRYLHKQSVLGPRKESSPSLPDREPAATINPVVHLTKRVDGRRSGGADAEQEAVRKELQRVNRTRNKSWRQWD